MADLEIYDVYLTAEDETFQRYFRCYSKEMMEERLTFYAPCSATIVKKEFALVNTSEYTVSSVIEIGPSGDDPLIA